MCWLGVCSALVLVWFWFGYASVPSWFWLSSGLFWSCSGQLLAWFWPVIMITLVGGFLAPAWLWLGYGLVLVWFWLCSGSVLDSSCLGYGLFSCGSGLVVAWSGFGPGRAMASV